MHYVAWLGSVAELRSIILKARRLADNLAEQARAAAAVKIWLLAQIAKKHSAQPDIAKPAADKPFAPERPAATARDRGKFKRNLPPAMFLTRSPGCGRASGCVR